MCNDTLFFKLFKRGNEDLLLLLHLHPALSEFAQIIMVVHHHHHRFFHFLTTHQKEHNVMMMTILFCGMILIPRKLQPLIILNIYGLNCERANLLQILWMFLELKVKQRHYLDQRPFQNPNHKPAFIIQLILPHQDHEEKKQY